MRRQDNPGEDRDVTRNSRTDEYDRYGYNRTNVHSLGSDDAKPTHDRDETYFQHSIPSSPHTGYYGKGPKGWKRSDEKIKDEVCEVLYRDQHLDATDIEVEVSDGIVTLKGSIDTRWSKRHAEERVEHLFGVEDVHNELRVLRFENDRLS
jgi:osmotically-inducible protein OsmY